MKHVGIMPICRKCNNSFPFQVKINDQYKNLCNRKYCLECSPFGSHNTRKLHELEVLKKAKPEEIVLCGCGRSYVYDPAKGHLRTKCNSCSANARRQEIKSKAIAYKGSQCCICGYSKTEEALAFHHLDPAQKDFTIAGKYSLAWNKLQAELDKCVLLCHNCHAEVHAGKN